MATEPSATPADDDHRRRRTGMIATIAAGVLLVVAVVVTALVGGQSGTPMVPGASPSPSASSDADPGPGAGDEPESPADDQVDPSVPADPVEILEPADISPGLTAAITKLESVSGEAQRPGEVAGPAVRVTVQVTNSTEEVAQLLTTVVTAYYGAEQTPALELGAPGASPMPTEVAPGQTATGIYVFTVPADQRERVRIMVDYSVDVRPLVFEGAIPE